MKNPVLVRLASALPSGSPEKKALLNLLGKSAAGPSPDPTALYDMIVEDTGGHVGVWKKNMKFSEVQKKVIQVMNDLGRLMDMDPDSKRAEALLLKLHPFGEGSNISIKNTVTGEQWLNVGDATDWDLM